MFPVRAFLFALILSTPLVASGQSNKFDVVKVAEGVYAAIRKEPPGLMFDANSVFIINDRDVFLVDTGISPASARETLAALRRLTDKPVRYVINTHWHDDHIIGNQVYREAFPGVEFIAHRSAPGDMATVGAENRKQLVTEGPAFVAEIRNVMSKNKSLGGWDLTEEERASYTSDIQMAERFFAEAPAFQIIPPTITVEDRLVIYRGDRSIEIRHLGRGHSGADLIVHLPKEGIVISGDLVVWPVPLVGSTSYPAEFAVSLEKLLALRPAIIIPGHGPVMRDDSYVKLMARLLNSISQQVASAVGRGETLEQTRKSVNLDEFRNAFAGTSKLKSFIFDFYVRGPAVTAAYRQASTKQ